LYVCRSILVLDFPARELIDLRILIKYRRKDADFFLPVGANMVREKARS
jgi:hypothetical protein